MTRHIDPVITPNGRFMARKSELAGPAVDDIKMWWADLRSHKTDLFIPTQHAHRACGADNAVAYGRVSG